MLQEFDISHVLPLFNLLYTGLMAFKFCEGNSVKLVLERFGLLADSKVHLAQCEFVDEENYHSCQQLAFYTGKVNSPIYREIPQVVATPPANSNAFVGNVKPRPFYLNNPSIIIRRRIYTKDTIVIRFCQLRDFVS